MPVLEEKFRDILPDIHHSFLEVSIRYPVSEVPVDPEVTVRWFETSATDRDVTGDWRISVRVQGLTYVGGGLRKGRLRSV